MNETFNGEPKPCESRTEIAGHMTISCLQQLNKDKFHSYTCTTQELH